MRKRWTYHKRLYQHKVSVAFSFMIIEILVEYFKVKEAHKLFDVEYYTSLDDTLIGEIRRSKDPRLARARELLRCIDLRKQPRLVWSSKGLPNLKAFKERYYSKENLSAAIGKYCSEQLMKVRDVKFFFEESDIIVHWGS